MHAADAGPSKASTSSVTAPSARGRRATCSRCATVALTPRSRRRLPSGGHALDRPAAGAERARSTDGVFVPLEAAGLDGRDLSHRERSIESAARSGGSTARRAHRDRRPARGGAGSASADRHSVGDGVRRSAAARAGAASQVPIRNGSAAIPAPTSTLIVASVASEAFSSKLFWPASARIPGP